MVSILSRSNLVLLFLTIISYNLFVQPALDDPFVHKEVAEWAANGRYFNYKGRPVYFQRSSNIESFDASRPYLLLVHGYPSFSYDWAKVWSGLEASFNLIAPDLLGHGFSSKDMPSNYSVFNQADMLVQLMLHLQIDTFHLLCHDLGDTVCEELLARQVDNERTGNHGSAQKLTVKSAVFLNGGLFPETHRAFLTQKLLQTPYFGTVLQAVVPRFFVALTFRRLFGPETQLSAQDEDIIIRMIHFRSQPGLLQQVQSYIRERSQNRERWVGSLNAVQRLKKPIPLRVINGPWDPISGLHAAERYRELVENADVVILGENIGHYPHLEDPAGVLKHFNKFHERIAPV